MLRPTGNPLPKLLLASVKNPRCSSKPPLT